MTDFEFARPLPPTHVGSADRPDFCRWCSEAYEFWPRAACSGKYPKRSLLDIALDVHMTTTGNSERSDREDEADRAYLQWRLDRWEEGLMSARTFDDAVKNLVRIALAEGFSKRVQLTPGNMKGTTLEGDAT